MQKKDKIKEKKKVIKTFYTNCSKCGKEIKGNAPSHVEINLKYHLEKCEKLDNKNVQLNNRRLKNNGKTK